MDDFESWYLAQHPRIVRAMTVVARDRDVAADAVAEAFSRAYQRWHELSRATNPDGWVYRVAVNVLRRRLRRQGVEARLLRRGAVVGVSSAAIVAMVVAGLLLRPERESAVLTAGPATTLSAETLTREEEMITALLAFAFRPSDESFAPLPFAPEVRLGVEDRVVATKSREELRDPDAWVVVGSHSALEVLAPVDDFVARRGTHETCVGEANPPPPDLAGYRRVGIQPAEIRQDTCLNWYSVDLFLQDGQIVGITLTLWEY